LELNRKHQPWKGHFSDGQNISAYKTKSINGRTARDQQMQKKLSNLKNQYVRLMHKAECATGRKEAVKHFHNASKVADEIKLLSTWK